jgi:uncharacterized protein related to proFAR isomerase
MLEAYEDYLEALLDANVEMASNKKKLVRFGSDLPAPERMSNMAGTYVVHSEFFAATQAESLQQWNSVLELRQQVPLSGSLETNIRTARRRTLQIAEQIISRLVHDADYGISCELINALDDNVQLDPLGLEDENAYGWRISLRFTTTRYEYDATDWNA